MHVMSPLRLKYGKHRERSTHMCTLHKRTGLFEYRKRNRSRWNQGLLGIPTRRCNRWWSEIQIQRESRRETERIRGKRRVFSTTCRLDWWPSCGQWGESGRRPGSGLTQTNDKSALALYCSNILPFRSTDRTYHTNHSACTCIRFHVLPPLSICLPLFWNRSLTHTCARTHTHTRTHQEKLNKCGNRCPTSDCSCPLLPVCLQRDRGIPLTKIRPRSPLLS